ncbi:MAG: TolC family protein [Acidobacteriota bacterium]|nr:TolC family protein [Acidobacteriota bacterium]
MPDGPRLSAVACLCLPLALVAATAGAQGLSGGPLDLQAAIDRALAANPTLAAARLRPAIDEAGIGVARERPNPEFTAEVEKETPRQTFAFAVPVELGGKRSRRIALGEATVRSAEAEVAATVLQVRNDVRRTYFGVLVAEARLNLLAEVRDIARRVLDGARQRFEAGSAPRLEVMQAELALASAETETDAARGRVEAARASLNVLLGAPLAATWSLSTPIDDGPVVTTDAVLALATSASTELAVLDRQVDAQRARVTLAGAQRVPDLIPTATLTRDSPPDFDYGWRAALTVTLPVFASHRAGVLVEQAALDQLLAERDAARLRIAGQVTGAAVTVAAERQRYLRYRDEVVPDALQVEQVAQDAYDLGQTGIVALLQALQSTRDVRLRALDSVAEYQNALADLERAIGVSLP